MENGVEIEEIDVGVWYHVDRKCSNGYRSIVKHDVGVIKYSVGVAKNDVGVEGIDVVVM